MKKPTFILLLFILQGIYFISCSTKVNEQDNATSGQAEFLETIKTIKAVTTSQQEELLLTGKVEYDPDRIINYVPLISGVVERTYFSLGDKVQKGQTLLDIRSTDFSTMQSDYIAAESEVRIAQREWQSAKEMFDDHMISEKDLLQAEGAVKQAEAVFQKVRSDMGHYGSNKGKGIFSIQSPMNGFIVGKGVASGSPVSSDSEPLFTVADLSQVWITANVYASNLVFVKEGMEVEITTLSYPDEVFAGKINVLSQIFDSEEKVLKARITMNNKELKFKPEMSVLVKLKDKSDIKKIAIPTEALIFDDNRYFVVIENTPGNFETKEVRLQGYNNNTTYIASGVEENENVVVKNQLLIFSGLKEK